MEFEKFRLEKGDVIITKDSESPDDIGIPCFVKDNFEDVVCGYHLTLIRPKNMDGGFIFRFIQSDKTRRYFEIHSNGITRFGLGKYSIENLFLPFPPLSEQNEIVSYLDEHTQLIDKTISVEERRIDTLKEYRQSLISEVVTGKRKVVN
jgi:type I restriction enzyme S subunit